MLLALLYHNLSLKHCKQRHYGYSVLSLIHGNKMEASLTNTGPSEKKCLNYFKIHCYIFSILNLWLLIFIHASIREYMQRNYVILSQHYSLFFNFFTNVPKVWKIVPEDILNYPEIKMSPKSVKIILTWKLLWGTFKCSYILLAGYKGFLMHF